MVGDSSPGFGSAGGLANEWDVCRRTVGYRGCEGAYIYIRRNYKEKFRNIPFEGAAAQYWATAFVSEEHGRLSL